MADRASCEPVKNFFINMITKDIQLADCILDLLDNCVDGAQRLNGKEHALPVLDSSYEGFKAEITIEPNQFIIKDNCGGISLENAKNYAFNFGRNPYAPPLPDKSIGLYGIGMKRAIFKIGRVITVFSSTKKEAFKVGINVDEWKNKNGWYFDLDECKAWEPPGTAISIDDLTEGTKVEFEDKRFINKLRTIIARDYSIFLQSGFKVFLNGLEIDPYEFSLREGEDFKPLKISYADETEEGVVVKIQAGMAVGPISDEEIPFDRSSPKIDYYGWFVSCNDRIVLAGDKTEKTVWGHDNFTRWHGQYNGFMGIISFYAEDPYKLPWDTTKRNLDVASPLYKRAVQKMKDATRPWVNYTNVRKEDLDEAKRLESLAESKPMKQLSNSSQMQLPKIIARPKVEYTSIQYQKPLAEVRTVKKALGSVLLSNKDVGIRTFEYYLENVVEEED